MTTATQRRDGINLAIELLFDKTRFSRHLAIARDGSIYATPDVRWIDGDGNQVTVPHVTVPALYDQETSTAEDDDVNEDADAIVDALIDLVAKVAE